MVRGVGIDARTTQSPANRGANPQRVGGRAGQPADPHSNACFAAEVQTNSEAAARLRDQRHEIWYEASDSVRWGSCQMQLRDHNR
jgi:hypothetical protein